MNKEKEIENFRNSEKYQEHIKSVTVTSPIEKGLREKKENILSNLIPLKRKVKEMEKQTRVIDEQIKYLLEKGA